MTSAHRSSRCGLTSKTFSALVFEIRGCTKDQPIQDLVRRSIAAAQSACPSSSNSSCSPCLRDRDIVGIATGVRRSHSQPGDQSEVTADGPKWLADAIVYATGFQASKVLSPMVVKGVGGLDLHATWGPDDAKAFLGMTVAGLPNFFMLLGPKTGLAHGGNASFMTECQVRYVGLCIDALGRSMHSVMDVRTEVFDRYTAEVDRLHDALVWRHKGLINWYRNEAGRVFA